MQKNNNKMAFRGIQNKNGRQPGSVNKITAEVRTAFALLLENNLEQLQDDIKELKPYERIKILIELAKFVVPTLKATELTQTINQDLTPIILQFNEKD